MKHGITITKKLANYFAGCVFVFLTASNISANTEGNSCGFFFDQFQLTLESGSRTEAAGPFYYSEKTENSTTLAYPPFYSSYQNPSVASRETDVLYPLFTSIHYGAEHRWQFFQLISFGGGEQQSGSERERTTLFPFYFSQRSTDTNKNYTAYFPFYGHFQDRFYHDKIFFCAFPFYSETQKRDVVVDNYLFPFVDVRRGNGMTGWQFWPFYGRQDKIPTLHTNGFGDVEIVGGYHRSFWLWPLHLKQDNGLGTTNVEKFRASLPLYTYTRSPQLDSTTVLWPFFTWLDNRDKKYREWQMPWPLIVFARGEGKTTDRVFPLFSLSHDDVKESDSYLWPVYIYKRTHSDPLDQQRTRVLVYLYSDVTEKNTKTGHYKRRLDMWPFFTWHRDFDGCERLQVIAPLEPAVPDNRGIERNWSPIWSFWRAEKNPATGAASQSLLWNLYRCETAPAHKKISLLFGLFQYQYDGQNRRTRWFYLPVSESIAAPAKTAQK